MGQPKPKQKSSTSATAEPELIAAADLCPRLLGEFVTVVGREVPLIGNARRPVRRHTGVVHAVRFNVHQTRVVMARAGDHPLAPHIIVEVTE